MAVVGKSIETQLKGLPEFIREGIVIWGALAFGVAASTVVYGLFLLLGAAKELATVLGLASLIVAIVVGRKFLLDTIGLTPRLHGVDPEDFAHWIRIIWGELPWPSSIGSLIPIPGLAMVVDLSRGRTSQVQRLRSESLATARALVNTYIYALTVQKSFWYEAKDFLEASRGRSENFRISVSEESFVVNTIYSWERRFLLLGDVYQSLIGISGREGVPDNSALLSLESIRDDMFSSYMQYRSQMEYAYRLSKEEKIRELDSILREIIPLEMSFTHRELYLLVDITKDLDRKFG
jgi:hypothetical protein